MALAGSQQEKDGGGAGSSDGCMFQNLCSNVTTAMHIHNNMLLEFLLFKDELLKHPLPSNLLLALTILSSRVYRSYSDLCTPVGELNRLVLQHSVSLEKNVGGLKKIRSNYMTMKRRMDIALNMMHRLSAQEEQRLHERRLGHWERLFCHVMQSKSHGRRWKFRIEPLRRKIASGWNPFHDSDSNSGSDNENEIVPENRNKLKGREGEDVDALPHTDRIGQKYSTKMGSAPFEATPGLPAPPRVHHADVSTSTSDPNYDNYLLVLLSRPTGTLKTDIRCTLSLGSKFYTSEIYPAKSDPTKPETLSPRFQSFYFPLSDDAVSCLPPSCQSVSSVKLIVEVYSRDTLQQLIATLSLPVKDIKLTEEPSVIIPPKFREKEFEMAWEKVCAEVSGCVPSMYVLSLQKERDEVDHEVPHIHMICHRVKVQRHRCMHGSTSTLPWEELMLKLGYSIVPHTQSREISDMSLGLHGPNPEEVVSEVRKEIQKEAEEHITKLAKYHQEEVEKLRRDYEDKLGSLSKTLAKVKAEKSQQIVCLEQGDLIEMGKSKGRNGRSPTEVQCMLEQKHTNNCQGLPDRGKDLAEGFLDRVAMLKEENRKKQEELTSKIKMEVQVACEKQLATHHRLAPGLNTSLEYDLTLPAIFLPSSKKLVFSPRAHQYFNPPGCTKRRVSQPPAVFKLPPLQLKGLFEPNKTSQMTELSTSKESTDHHSSNLTPAPLPGVCPHYHIRPHTSGSIPAISFYDQTTSKRTRQTLPPEKREREASVLDAEEVREALAKEISIQSKEAAQEL